MGLGGAEGRPNHSQPAWQVLSSRCGRCGLHACMPSLPACLQARPGTEPLGGALASSASASCALLAHKHAGLQGSGGTCRAPRVWMSWIAESGSIVVSVLCTYSCTQVAQRRQRDPGVVKAPGNAGPLPAPALQRLATCRGPPSVMPACRIRLLQHTRTHMHACMHGSVSTPAYLPNVSDEHGRGCRAAVSAVHARAVAARRGAAQRLRRHARCRPACAAAGCFAAEGWRGSKNRCLAAVSPGLTGLRQRCRRWLSRRLPRLLPLLLPRPPLPGAVSQPRPVPVRGAQADHRKACFSGYDGGQTRSEQSTPHHSLGCRAAQEGDEDFTQGPGSRVPGGHVAGPSMPRRPPGKSETARQHPPRGSPRSQ